MVPARPPEMRATANAERSWVAMAAITPLGTPVWKSGFPLPAWQSPEPLRDLTVHCRVHV